MLSPEKGMIAGASTEEILNESLTNKSLVFNDLRRKVGGTFSFVAQPEIRDLPFWPEEQGFW